MGTSPFWQYRIAVPGYKNRFIRKSTGKSDFEAAKEFAIREYDRLRLRDEEGLPVVEISFAKVGREYLKRKKRQVQSGTFSEANYRTISSFLNNHAEPYFRSKNIGSIRKKDCPSSDYLGQRGLIN